MSKMNGPGGVSTCEPGEERWEKFKSRIAGRWMVHYDFRTPDGALFSTIARTLAQARAARDAWLKVRKGRG